MRSGIRLAILAAAYLAAACALAVLCFTDASARLPPCPVRFFTGLYCPGCGAARALRCVMHGELRCAFRYNPALCVLLPGIAVYLPVKSLYFLKGIERDPLHRAPAWVFIAILTALLLFGALRNLPFFGFLSPPA